jgi:rhamnose utilization protein RhaD (predicted bifunctional aldolase and dehydrogenase)
MTSLNDLVRASRRVGASPAFVQGAGGNTSIKRGRKMYVKASGFLLRDMAKKKGYVCCDFGAMEAYLKKIPSRKRYSQTEEDAFNFFIEQHLFVRESFGVPSIETGTHAVLKAAAIHTHNVYANVFGCMKGGEKYLQEIFKGQDFLYVPYSNPGLALSKALFEEKKKLGQPLPGIIFLGNHGLLTHADTMDEALRLSLNVNKKLSSFLERRGIKPFSVQRRAADISKHLFPDSVVYSQIDFTALPPHKKAVFYEISSVVNYIRSAIKRLGGMPTTIPAVDVRFIKGMGKEKHRIKMAKKS